MEHIHNEKLLSHTLNETMQQSRRTEDSSAKSARHEIAGSASSHSHVQSQRLDSVDLREEW